MKAYNVNGNLIKQSAPGPISQWRKRHLWIQIIASLLLLLFSYTGVNKVTEYAKFKDQLGKSPFLEQHAATIAWFIPATECVIVLLLLFKMTRLAGLFASFALMLAFTIYIYMMLHYSYYVPCSCGGVLAMMSWTQHFWFNVVFTLLAFSGILLHVVQPQK
ncbi:MauE/DoxX family redox-associated membrane protein [Longitalea luteola]|uniref:MauE/DoxX family redox-associated membrane protein n=1 Tax=Longitalea luteola TaxID=2812563 RepID=UPI001A95D498|nr:MauE/DoxX family redox-associated membrane protein [Longitalea luteola]